MDNDKNHATQPSNLTKREYFAGLAMQGLVSDATNAESNGYEVNAERTAEDAVAIADALLQRLNATGG